MDNFDLTNVPGDGDLSKPIPLDDELDKPIPLDDGGTSGTGVSHSPLNLGGPAPAEAPARPEAPKIELPKPAVTKPQEQIASTEDRITGVRTFFTKLHPGAIQFLDEQISNWLKENPGVNIKRTNITVGEVQAKKTEPNIIITVWY
jgi:hypothetical protein